MSIQILQVKCHWQKYYMWQSQKVWQLFQQLSSDAILVLISTAQYSYVCVCVCVGGGGMYI